MKNKIILVGGDPNSINSEIIYKSWKKLDKNIKKKIYLIGSYNLFKQQFKKLKIKLKISKLTHINQEVKDVNLKIIDINLNFKNCFNVNQKYAKKYVLKCLDLAHILSKKNEVLGLINCPINKKLLSNKNAGVTEYFAAKCKIPKNTEVMVIYNQKISVVPITTHIKIKNVSNKISLKLLIRKVLTLNKEFKKIFNKKPKIGMLGLNPHNNEFSKNSEELKKIIPAIMKLKSKGISIKGPLVADTIFINYYKNYDVLVGMYHDQVLAPFKALFHFNAINLTLGLKYLRLSPDHGPAYDIVGKNLADETSLILCFKFLNNFK